MKEYFLAYGITAVAFFVIDAVWLSTMTKVFYGPRLGHLLANSPRLIPAALFYSLYIFGVVFFAVMPALASGQWITALTHGALFGLCAYATYDLTNEATLKEWPSIVSLVDTIWGTVLTAASASISFFLTQFFG